MTERERGGGREIPRERERVERKRNRWRKRVERSLENGQVRD